MASDGGSPKDDPETWSLPSVLGVRTSDPGPRTWASQQISARPAQPSRPSRPQGGSVGSLGSCGTLDTEMAEIEAELLRGVSLSTALNGLGFLELESFLINYFFL